MAQIETWIRYLPAFLRDRLEGRHNLWRILTNVSWLFADRILRMGVGLLIGVWIARYLGPEQFGVLNYAIAFVGLFLPLAMLGLDNVAVRDLVQEPARSHETLGTAFILKLAAGIGTYGLALAVIITLKPEASLLHALVGLTGAGLVFQAFDAVDFWFQSQVRSKYVVVARNTSFLITSLIRVAFVLAAAPLIVFAGAVALEAALSALGLVLIYQWSGQHFRDWRAKRRRAAELLRTSWPLIVSAVAIAVYLRIGQIMIGEVLGDIEVGIYAAAVRISEVWYFIPTAIVSSVAPALTQAKEADAALYKRRAQQLLNMMAGFGYAVAIPVSLLAGPLIRLLYGAEYADAGLPLAVHIWAGLFVCLGVAQSMWLLLEGHTQITLINTVVGALVNIGLNLVLIPKFGSLGAAIATLASYIVAIFACCFFYAPTRPIGFMVLKSLIFRA